MKYTIELAGRSFEVEIEGSRVVLDGRPVEATLAGGRGTAIRQLIRGRSHSAVQAAPGEENGSWQLSIGGFRFMAQVLAPRELAKRNAANRAGRPGDGILKAPMPGLVVRVLVEQGAVVEAGQGLVVVEAMKMENELKARGPGTVRKVHVTPGTKVEKGAVLLEMGD